MFSDLMPSRGGTHDQEERHDSVAVNRLPRGILASDARSERASAAVSSSESTTMMSAQEVASKLREQNRARAAARVAVAPAPAAVCEPGSSETDYSQCYLNLHRAFEQQKKQIAILTQKTEKQEEELATLFNLVRELTLAQGFDMVPRE